MNLFEKRSEKAQSLMAESGIDYLFVGPGTDMQYICGYDCHKFERLTMFIQPVDQKPSFITPSFEVPRFELMNIHMFFDLLPWEETDDPLDLVTDLVSPTKSTSIAVDDKHWGMFITGYLKKLPNAKIVSAEPVLGEMRMHKDATELKYLKHIGEALDKIWDKALTLDYSGRTETEVGADLYEIKKGIFNSTLEISNRGPSRPTSGINSSSAHGGGSDRVIQPGDPIYWEMGRGSCHGYEGDKTRSAQVAPATDEYRKIYEVVKEAQQTAFEAVRPGVTCESIDMAGRRVIEKAGYGEFFTHRIGHGLGLDSHEPPYLVGGNKRILEPGMVFSVEPGIYFPNKWGIRIEDIVYVTEDGAESFYNSTKEFHEVQ